MLTSKNILWTVLIVGALFTYGCSGLDSGVVGIDAGPDGTIEVVGGPVVPELEKQLGTDKEVKVDDTFSRPKSPAIVSAGPKDPTILFNPNGTQPGPVSFIECEQESSIHTCRIPFSDESLQGIDIVEELENGAFLKLHFQEEDGSTVAQDFEWNIEGDHIAAQFSADPGNARYAVFLFYDRTVSFYIRFVSKLDGSELTE